MAALALGLCALVGTASAGPGRVIRVNRGHGGTHRLPRICQATTADGGTCWGQEPQVGEIAVVMDTSAGVLGRVQVVKVEPQINTCGNPQSWTFKAITVSGRVDRLALGANYALFDIDVSEGKSHMLDPQRQPLPSDRNPNEQVWSALDADGDGNSDLIGTAYPCNDPNAIAKPGTQMFCVDYLQGDHGDWRRLREDRVGICN